MLLAAGQPHDAVRRLARYEKFYVNLFKYPNFLVVDFLNALMAALKVLADALEQMAAAENRSRWFGFFRAPLQDLVQARRIRADVEETEAIVAGYWEGVLDETRRELREQQWAAAAAGCGLRSALTKSKTARRKQQKRRAQQQKKAAEMAEAAAATTAEAVASGADVTQEQVAEEHEHEVGKRDEEEGSKNHAMTVAAAALAAMSLDEKKGEAEKEESEAEEEAEEEEAEEEEEECAVCLNMIDSDDVNNPAGPPLNCGHRYHAFCLHFWVARPSRERIWWERP